MRVYPRGKRGILWVDLTIDGERLKRSAGTTDRREAEEYAAALASGVWRTKRLGEAPRVTWDTAVLAWLGEHGHRRSIEDIKLKLTWLTERLQGKALADVDDALIRRLASERKQQEVGPGKPSSNATVNRHLAELSKILHYAQARKWLAAVPPIAKMHEPAKRVAWLTQEQAGALLSELPDHLRGMAAFALATGLRESNVRLLCWQQVDMRRGVAWIHADEAKGARDLNVPLSAEAVAVLEQQRSKHSRWVFPVPHRLAGAVIADAPTGKISNHAWRKACARAGVPWLRFHDLRHTWASWHVQNGTPLPVLRELGGWATLAMVEKYAHLGVSHVAAWAGNGTNRAQVSATDSQKEAATGRQVGWLMGLEPTTTGITIGSHRAEVRQIKDLREPGRRKAG